MIDENKMEDSMLDTMFSMLELGGMKMHRGDLEALKAHCLQLRQMMLQKTAGQRKNKPKDLDFANLPRIKNSIILEAMLLVLSGKLDEVKWDEQPTE